jgi:hypothetical protein
MKQFIGVKFVSATKMPLGDYNKHRGWEIPADEDPAAEGYLVVYPDGYQSWCPKEQFELANRECNAMSFGHAIEAAKQGKKIARAGWNGKNMFVVLMPELYLPPYNTTDTARKVNDRTAKHIGEDTPLDSQPYFTMFTATGQWQPGWLASQADMLSDDWGIVG